MTSKVYNIYISSRDKISGTNNNTTFLINWDTILPNNGINYYKVSFSFQTYSGYYKDTVATTQNGNYTLFSRSNSTIKILSNFQSPNLSYDTSTKSQSLILGYAQRAIEQSDTTIGNFFACFHNYNAPKIIMKPTSPLFNIQLINNYSNGALTDTTSAGVSFADCTIWTMILQLEEC